MSEFLNIKKAADYLGVSISTLRNWDRNDHLKPSRNPFNNYRVYTKNQLDNFFYKNKWINSNDLTPEMDQHVLLFRNIYPKFYWMGKYKDFHMSDHTHTDNYTHWMVIPIPPENENEG